MNTGIFWTFGIFFMPLRINQTISDIDRHKSASTINKGLIQKNNKAVLTQFGFEETERSEHQKQKIIQNLGNLISQRIAIKNLHQNKKEYKKYIRKKVKCISFKLNWVNFRNQNLMSNSVVSLRLNRFELIIFRFLLITLFFVQWMLIAALFTVAIFHQNWVSILVFWLMIMYPHLLTHLYTIWNHLCYVRINFFKL